jgi:hypothetical protein
MAQAKSSSSTRTRRNSSSSKKRSTNRNGSSGPSKTRSRSAASRSAGSRNGTSKVSELASKAKPPAKTVRKTSEKVSEVASKAKTPLVAGGAALAGIAGGIALRSRTESRRPVKNFRTRALPQSLKNIDFGKVDLDALTSAARRVRSIGEQVGEVADAADKTRKKHK